MNKPEFITIEQAISALGLGPSMIRRLCGQGRIAGAEKVAGAWRIPFPPVILPEHGYEGEYMNASEVAEWKGITRQRVSELLNMGRIKGARKIRGRWAIPTPVEITESPPGRPRTSGMMEEK